MKQLAPFLKKIAFVVLFFMAVSPLKATIYTAVVSGNFSNAATWGGMAPPLIVTADEVIIPSGINVTLDQNVTVSGSASVLTINGSLTSANNKYLSVVGGSFTGTGNITLDSLSLALFSGFSFAGSINTQYFHSSATNIFSAATIIVAKTLYVAGNLNIAAGSVSLSNNATIIIKGGTIIAGTGGINLNNGYNVIYTTASATAGIELSGNGLKNIEIAVPANSTVTLSTNLDIDNALTLTSGALVLNNHNLSFGSTGTLAAIGSGTISSTAGSDIVINSSSFPGTLMFTPTASTVNNLTINLGTPNSSVVLNSDLTVANQLNLQSGKLDVNTSILIVSAGTVTGGSSSNYVITGIGGALGMTLNAGNSLTYHIGTPTNYAPVTITANTGSANTMVSAGVNANVYSQGTTGAIVSATQPVVNATWHINSTAASGIDLNLQLMWDATMEVNGFNRNTAYISHFMNGSWDMSAIGAATMTGSLYSLTRANVTSLSPFAVVDQNAVLTNINEVNSKNGVSVYPNPANTSLYFEAHNKTIVRVDIYNIVGKLIKTVSVDNAQSFSVGELAPGMYTARFYGQEVHAVQQFVKE